MWLKVNRKKKTFSGRAEKGPIFPLRSLAGQVLFVSLVGWFFETVFLYVTALAVGLFLLPVGSFLFYYSFPPQASK